MVPRTLIVGADKKQAAEILLANATRSTTTEKTTPEWVANLTLAVEPRIASTNVYLYARESSAAPLGRTTWTFSGFPFCASCSAIRSITRS